MPNRESITGKLEAERKALLDRDRSFKADELDCACTESEDPGGDPWRPKDHLAHLAMIERAFQGMIRRTVAGEKNPVGFTGTTRDAVLAGVHRNNQENVDAHRGDDLDALVADLDAARTETLELLDSLSDAQLSTPVPGAPWADGTIGGVLMTNAYHERQHLEWVEDGLARHA